LPGPPTVTAYLDVRRAVREREAAPRVVVLRDAVAVLRTVERAAVVERAAGRLAAGFAALRAAGFAAFFAAGLAAGFAAAFLAAGFAATFLAAGFATAFLAAGFAATFLAAGFATAFLTAGFAAARRAAGFAAALAAGLAATRLAAGFAAALLAAGLAVALAAVALAAGFFATTFFATAFFTTAFLATGFFAATAFFAAAGFFAAGFARAFAAVARDPEREDELREAPERELELRELDDRDDLAAAATARGLVDSTVSDMSGDMSPWVMNDLLLFGFALHSCPTNRVFSAQFGRRTARGAVGRPSGDRFVVHVVLCRVRLGERVDDIHRLEIGGVDANERLPFLGQGVLGEDRLDGALGLAGTAVDALLGVDHEHPAGLVDAVHGADVDARLVLDVDAGLGDDVRHGGLLYRREQGIDHLMRPLEKRRFHHHTVETRRMRATKPGSVRMVGEPENRHFGEAVRDIVRIDPRDIYDHEVGRFDAVGGLETMLREERLELAPEEEVDPCEQDRSHA